jgi:hypothetical protein
MKGERHKNGGKAFVTVVVVVVGCVNVGTVWRGKVVGGEAYKFKGSQIARV